MSSDVTMSNNCKLVKILVTSDVRLKFYEKNALKWGRTKYEKKITLAYVVVRRVRPEMHKISNVCRRTDNTLLIS